MQAIRYFNIFAFVVCAVQAFLIVWMSRSHQVFQNVYTGLLTKDNLVSAVNDKPEQTTAFKHLFDVRLSWLLAGLLATAGLTYLLSATLLKSKVESDVKSGINKVRWYGFAVTVGFMAVIIAMISGVVELSLLLAVVMAVAISYLLSSEVEAGGISKLVKLLSLKGLAFGLFVPAFYMFATHQYGEGGVAKAAYYSAAIFVATVLLSRYIMKNAANKSGRMIDYLFADRAYSWLLLIAVSALTWQVYAGFIR